MKRVVVTPRPNWVDEVRKYGMVYEDFHAEQHWKESAYYEFESAEIDRIEAATNALWQLSLEAVQHVIDGRRYRDLGIPEVAIPLIERSWEEDHPSLYGRFDLAYRPGEPVKLLEFNADTPTVLLEASVIQWQWLQQVAPAADQFNSIHEHLVAKWLALRADGCISPKVYFAHVDYAEDFMTATYLRDTAQEAGLDTAGLHMDQIRWDMALRQFCTPEGELLHTLFKLYPWEWMWKEPFAEYLPAKTTWIEPAWKLVLSNKAILAILWELFPRHEYLLPAYLDSARDLTAWVRKPAFGREGCNIAMRLPSGEELSTEGDYADERPLVYQAYTPLARFDSQTVVMGSWVINDEACGIGLRESAGPITRNETPFVPHLFRS